MDLSPDVRDLLFRLADDPAAGGGLALDSGDPGQLKLIGEVLEASGKGPDRYPALHADLAAGRTGDVRDDSCTIVDMGVDSRGRATTRSWLGSRGRAYISGQTTAIYDTASREPLAQGVATQVGGTLVRAATRAAEARPATAEMTAITLFHSQQAPEGPLRYGIASATRRTEFDQIPVNVVAPVIKINGHARIKIGLARDLNHMTDVDYAYLESVNRPNPDRLVVPFVGSADFNRTLPDVGSISALTMLYVSSPKAWLDLRPGFSLLAGYKVNGTTLEWEFPCDGKPVAETKSIQYEECQQANDVATDFLFQFTVPFPGSPPGTFSVCSYDTPEPPSLNCKQIPDLEYWWHCLGEDTAIALADGAELPIGEADNAISVRTGFGDEVREVEATSRARHDDNGGREPALRLSTEGGRSLLLSGAHPVLTPAGPVAAADLRPGDIVLAADGEDRVRACAPEPYDGLVYNLAVAPGAGGFGSFLANGIVVGDHRAQADHDRARRHDPEHVLARLPQSHHRDYLSALADVTAG